MKKIFRILGLAMVVVAILAVAFAGTVSATGGVNPDNGSQTQTQNHGDGCICGECPCGDCVCDGSNCTPNL